MVAGSCALPQGKSFISKLFLNPQAVADSAPSRYELLLPTPIEVLKSGGDTPL
jgi:hypothetical protein